MNLHSPSKSNTKIVHKFLALFLYVCTLRLAIFTHVDLVKNVAYFPFNSWFSFQRYRITGINLLMISCKTTSSDAILSISPKIALAER